MFNPGMILSNRYEIIESVGSGGMSEVYKAKCHVLNRYVAIKVLKPEFSADVNFVTKFRIEAQSAAGLSHPNIVNVYDVGEDNGIYYIVMELVEGITLKEYIQRNGRLSAEQAIDFSIQIAQGLEVAHENHTIHRDIKPQNIIVSKNGSLKVTDFGIARAASSNTMTSNAMGSVHYISPEQARGGFSDERSDIYSLGITMYEMLTGHVPFEGENNVAIALMHIQGEMVSPREYYPDIPTSLEKVIMKCTQKKPERRYLTANALIADLKRVQANPDIDCVVVSPVVNNSPTVEMTSAEMKAIKEGRQLNEAVQVEQPRSSQAEAQVKIPVMRSSKFDDIFGEEDEDDEDEMQMDETLHPSEEEDEFDELDPKLKKIIMISSIAVAVIITILIILIIGKIAGWKLFGGKDRDASTSVTTSEESTEETPIIMIDVTGLYKTAAEEQLKKAGFTNYTFELQTDSLVEEGYVISQSVDEGSSILADEEIIIYVSAGKELTKVPDVRGYTDEQATTMLKEANLEVTHGFEYDDEVEKDHVISQDIAPDSEVPEGTTVKIIVSNGKAVVETVVPNLVGMTESQAEDALSSANLVGSSTTAYDDTVEAGLVISQTINANTTVEEGTTVSYVISQGPEKITYQASFSGSITNSSYDFETSGNVTVTVTYTIGDATYTLYSGAAGVDTFPLDLSASNPITGLSTNTGSFNISIVDSEGNNVTGNFNTGGVSASFTQE